MNPPMNQFRESASKMKSGNKRVSRSAKNWCVDEYDANGSAVDPSARKDARRNKEKKNRKKRAAVIPPASDLLRGCETSFWSQPKFKASPNPEQVPLPSFMLAPGVVCSKVLEYATTVQGSVSDSQSIEANPAQRTPSTHFTSASSITSDDDSAIEQRIIENDTNSVELAKWKSGSCSTEVVSETLTINLKRALMIYD